MANLPTSAMQAPTYEDPFIVQAGLIGAEEVKSMLRPSSPIPITAQANKWDDKKDCRPGLIAWEMIHGIGKVLAFGAKKYSPGNWALGMDWSRPIDALDRHWTAWKSGEKNDPETGYSHLWHMGCCLMFLIAYEARNIGRDDRVEVGLMAAPRKEAA